jgi:hypothetical protein
LNSKIANGTAHGKTSTSRYFDSNTRTLFTPLELTTSRAKYKLLAI